MACCILAAFLMAQAMAVLRRWAIFWGLARPRADEDADTAFRRIREFFGRPHVRRLAVAALAIEMLTLGSWAYVEHGTHIYQEADRLVSGLRGERIVYAGVCRPSGEDGAVRIVLNDARHPLIAHN